MNEFDDINLPADFDDLSKHAPLLDQLRFKGEGFVVPDGYFVDAGDLAVSVSRLSAVGDQESGFTVPENYFEELAERIIAIVNLASLDTSKTADRQQPTDNSFSVPQGYFEKLTDEIIAVSNLASLKNTESFELPEGYFSDLDETLNTKLALDNLKQDEGFGVPEGYFEKLSGKILSRVAVDELNQVSDAEVPSGYFDTLADRISARIAEQENVEPERVVERGRIIVFAEVLKRYSRPISIAASVTLLISVSIWFFNRDGNVKTNSEIAKNLPVKKDNPIVIPQIKKQDSVIAPKQIENIAVVKAPKQKTKDSLNPQQENVVKELEKNDIMEQLDLLDENVVAEYVSAQNPKINVVQQEEYLNDQMMDYILGDNVDVSDINKLP